MISESTSWGVAWSLHPPLFFNGKYQGFSYSAVVKNLPANAGDARDVFSSLGWKDSPEKEMEICSSILVWEIPWTEEPGELQSMGLQNNQT